MKTFIGVMLVLGMLLFQSNLFHRHGKLLFSVLGLMCFIGLIAWLFYTKKKQGSDPAIMMNDTDAD